MRSKLTPRTTQRLLDALAAGVNPSAAAINAHVSPSSVLRWLSKGYRQPGTPYAEFRAAYFEARAFARSGDAGGSGAQIELAPEVLLDAGASTRREVMNRR